ncbi:unnamed protein product [Absidia cylindrospora]
MNYFNNAMAFDDRIYGHHNCYDQNCINQSMMDLCTVGSFYDIPREYDMASFYSSSSSSDLSTPMDDPKSNDTKSNPARSASTTAGTSSNVKKPRAKDSGKKRCSNCFAKSSPSWRRSIEGSKLLCNACGLYEKVNGRKRVVYVQQDGSVKVARGNHYSSSSSNSCPECRQTESR